MPVAGRRGHDSHAEVAEDGARVAGKWCTCWTGVREDVGEFEVAVNHRCPGLRILVQCWVFAARL